MKVLLASAFAVLFLALSVQSQVNNNGYVACTTTGSLTITGTYGDVGCTSYSDRLTRTWIITVPSNNRVVLSFSTFDTEANYDFLKIYDGTSSADPLLGSYSGSSVPGPFTSSGSSLFLTFTADQYVHGNGFHGTFQAVASLGNVVACTTSTTRTFNNATGTFGCSSIGNNLSSSWTINGAANEILTLTFDTFNTETGYDWVTVYDGSSTSGTQLGHFSGSTLPAPITATGSHLYITLVTDYSIASNGFTAHWSGVVNELDPCYNTSSRVLVQREGYLGCPYGYGNDITSSWLIHPLGDFIIQLDFLSLDTQAGVDIITVYNGQNASAPVVGRYSGTVTPGTIVSSENALYITFTTDYAVVQRGFTATYQTVHALPEGGCAVSNNITLTAPQDSIGCNQYLPGVFEAWYLVAQDQLEKVSLTWHSFALGTGDTVTVYDGPTTFSPIVTGYPAGNTTLPPPVVSTGQYLTVVFNANNDGNTGAGFSAVYESVLIEDETSCASSHSSTLTDQQGDFGCDGYGDGVTVSWEIVVQTGYIVQLRFNSFYTENGYDYVTVYDGPDATYASLGSYSGAFRPPPLTSTSNYLYVVLTSDASINRSGFSASYSSIFVGNSGSSCFSNNNYNLTGTDGNLGCNGYANNVAVSWSITVASGSLVGLEFLTFQTESNYDFVKVYDGSGTSSPLLASLSGSSLPSPLRATSNRMYVRFTSDASVTFDGFTANYNSIASSSIARCGTSSTNTLTAPEGQFGCNGYDNNVDSSWSITAASGSRITLTFSTLDTESYYDYVKIYDGSNNHAQLLGTYSGTTLPSAPIQTTSNLAYVTFHSDSSVSSSYTGFTIGYVSYGNFGTSCTSNAAYNLNLSSGSFGCDGYANAITITWTISSYGPIHLEFDRFDTEQNYDIVYIFDGTSNSYPSLGRFSGTTTYPVQSTGNNMFIKFTSDSSITRSGFSAVYATYINIDVHPTAVVDAVEVPKQEIAADRKSVV